MDTSIELATCGLSNRDMNTCARWEYEVLDHCFDDIDFISLHTYFENPHDKAEEFLANIELLEYFIRAVAAIADAVVSTAATLTSPISSALAPDAIFLRRRR